MVLPVQADDSRRHRGTTIRIAVILFLLLAHLIATLFTVVPGYLSIDEALFHWMTKSFSDTGGLSLWNGYDEFPSTEFQHPFISLHNERLYSPIPYLFPILCFPLHHVAGYFGLFLVNSFAYIGVVALCFFTALKLFKDPDLALNACLILVLATFSWEYSQAAWPHAVNMAVVHGAFLLMVCGLQAERGRSARRYAYLAGLTVGLGAGVRVDAVLALPALVLPFAFARPVRIWEAVLVVFGAVPGFVVLATTNYVKFGELSPLTYGQARGAAAVPHYGLVGLAILVTIVAWVMSRDSFRDAVRRYRVWMICLGVAVVLVALGIDGTTRDFSARMLNHAYVSLVDIRALDPSLSMPPMVRSSGGGVVYNGGHKKALLQSLPYLPMLFLPLVALVRRDKDLASLAILWLVPVTVITYHTYSFLQLEGGGGLSLNLRYLTICLPFVAILAAYALRELAVQWGRSLGWRGGAVVAVVVLAVFVLCTRRPGVAPDSLELPLLVAPLIAAGLLAVVVVVSKVWDLRRSAFLSAAGWALVLGTMLWAGLVGIFYDYPHHRHARAMNLRYAEQLLAVVPDDVLFVAGRGFFTASLKLKEKDRIRIAFPARDGFRDCPALVAFYLSTGKRVFGVFYEAEWEHLERSHLSGYRTVPVLPFRGFSVREIAAAR